MVPLVGVVAGVAGVDEEACCTEEGEGLCSEEARGRGGPGFRLSFLGDVDNLLGCCRIGGFCAYGKGTSGPLVAVCDTTTAGPKESPSAEEKAPGALLAGLEEVEVLEILEDDEGHAVGDWEVPGLEGPAAA